MWSRNKQTLTVLEATKVVFPYTNNIFQDDVILSLNLLEKIRPYIKKKYNYKKSVMSYLDLNLFDPRELLYHFLNYIEEAKYLIKIKNISPYTALLAIFWIHLKINWENKMKELKRIHPYIVYDRIEQLKILKETIIAFYNRKIINTRDDFLYYIESILHILELGKSEVDDIFINETVTRNVCDITSSQKELDKYEYKEQVGKLFDLSKNIILDKNKAKHLKELFPELEFPDNPVTLY